MARPRSVRAHNQALEAAIELFAQNGFDSTSMDSIAEASGVSKATIYKHWSDKNALCLEVMAKVSGMDEDPVLTETDDLYADLVAALSYRQRDQPTEMQTRLMPHFFSYAARNPEFGHAWRTRAIEWPRKILTRLLKRGVEKGQLPKTLDYDFSIALLWGPMIYRYFLSLAKQKLPDEMPRRIVDSFWKAHALPIGVSGKRRRDRETRENNETREKKKIK
jgi:AcrR family transcriptional regulator